MVVLLLWCCPLAENPFVDVEVGWLTEVAVVVAVHSAGRPGSF